MKRISLFFILCLLLSFMLPLATLSAGAAVSANMDDQAWNSIAHKYCRFENKQQLMDEVLGYAQAIADLTGEKNWADRYGNDGVAIEITFTGQSSHVEGGYDSYKKLIPRIYINQTMAEYNFWPLAHELTHLICPYYSSLSLREGLASYMQDKVGKNCSIFNYGIDVHACAQIYLASGYENIIDAIGSSDLSKSASLAASKQRAAFYLCSYSFSKYLIEQYDMQRFMNLYKSKNLQKECLLIYKKDMRELKDDWLLFLNSYPIKLTQKDVDLEIDQILLQHNYSEG